MFEHVLLTEEEAAELLRVDSTDVIALVEDGSLAGFRVRNKWRITLESVKEQVARNLRKQNKEVLKSALQDHNTWAKVLRESPELVREIENGQYEPGSMGAFLQEVLAVTSSGKSGNVVSIKRDTEDDS